MDAQVVTTADGGSIELRPCPSWCVGGHFSPDAVIHASDGFHHYGPIIVITTADMPAINSEAMSVELYLESWVCPLDAEPGSPRIGMNIVGLLEGVDLTLAEANRVAQALTDLVKTARSGRV